MKHRLYSAFFLLLIVTTAVALDLRFGVSWFSMALLVVVLSMGTRECLTLLRLGAQRRSTTAVPHLLDHLVHGGWTVACIGVPGLFLLALRHHEKGLLLVLYLIAVSKMVDNGALLVGSLWGRHKLAPKISPAKTLEGVGGGLLAGIATSVLLGPSCTNSSWPFFLIFGGVIGALSVLGDLAESVLKRKAGVKDSGSLLPGIGGVLDLMDSVLLSAPAAYFLLAR